MADEECPRCLRHQKAEEWNLTCCHCEREMGAIISHWIPQRQYCAQCMDDHYNERITLDGCGEPIPF
jgi:hypothetical protein